MNTVRKIFFVNVKMKSKAFCAVLFAASLVCNLKYEIMETRLDKYVNYINSWKDSKEVKHSQSPKWFRRQAVVCIQLPGLC